MKRIRYLITISLCVVFPKIFAQIILTLPSYSGCPDTFSIPVQTQHFDSVASMSLKINYDSTILQYDTTTDVHPAFSTGVYMQNVIHQQIIISWFSLNPVNIESGDLLVLHFHHLISQTTDLIWDTSSCVITNISGAPLPTLYTDAHIVSLLTPPLLIFPPDHDQYVSLQPMLQWSTTGCSEKYELEYSVDSMFQSNVYSTTTLLNQYTILQPLIADTMYFWRVRALMESTIYTSGWQVPFRFHTLDPDGISEPSAPSIYQIKIFPNPTVFRPTLELEIFVPGTLSIKLFSAQGHKMAVVFNRWVQPGKYSLPLDIPLKTSQMYFVHSEFYNPEVQLKQSFRFLYIGK